LIWSNPKKTKFCFYSKPYFASDTQKTKKSKITRNWGDHPGTVWCWIQFFEPFFFFRTRASFSRRYYWLTVDENPKGGLAFAKKWFPWGN